MNRLFFNLPEVEGVTERLFESQDFADLVKQALRGDICLQEFATQFQFQAESQAENLREACQRDARLFEPEEVA